MGVPSSLGQQQVVGRVNIDDVTRHLRVQIPDLASKLDLSHRARASGIEAIDGNLDGAQSMSENPQVLHDLVGHNAQCGSWINLNATNFR